METNKIYHWDNIDVLKTFPDNSIDSIVTDPPYWLSFMGKKWDYDVPSQELWEECFRVLKPWWHLLAFAWTRTQHRMAVRIEDAGFEIRDMIAWVYGSWFPKSHNIGKAVDKLQGDEREIVKNETRYNYPSGIVNIGQGEKKLINRVVTKGTSKYEGWGTTLKPALEPITVARKPLSEKTIAENVLKWGTGGINIDESRVVSDTITVNRHSGYNSNSLVESTKGKWKGEQEKVSGRFPANLIHDGSDEVLELFPISWKWNWWKPYNYAGKEYNNKDTSMFNWDKPQAPSNFNDSGSASRFFYCAKASKSERNAGLEWLETKQTAPARNYHPTVKPLKLMEYLVRLVTPKWWICLDPFIWSWTTAVACKTLGFDFIGIEREQEYVETANKRLENIQKPLFPTTNNDENEWN